MREETLLLLAAVLKRDQYGGSFSPLGEFLDCPGIDGNAGLLLDHRFDGGCCVSGAVGVDGDLFGESQRVACHRIGDGWHLRQEVNGEDADGRLAAVFVAVAEEAVETGTFYQRFGSFDSKEYDRFEIYAQAIRKVGAAKLGKKQACTNQAG